VGHETREKHRVINIRKETTMHVKMRDIASIRPYPRNPRHNDPAVAAVAASIRAFGFRQPLVIDEDGVIVVGETRYKAALQLGLKAVPVHVASGLTAAQLKAYRIADNKTAELADWNQELLVQELADLQKLDIDLDLIGFPADELQSLFSAELEPGLTDPDDVPEPPDEPVTRPGDLWRLGAHRLLCGDAGKREDVDRLLEGAPVHLVNTDCPYNVRVEPRSNNAIAAGLSSFESVRHHQKLDLARCPAKAKPTTKKLRAKDRPLANDFLSEAEFDRLLHAWFGNIARVLMPGRAFYLWGGYANCGNYPPVLKATGLYFSQAVIWVKEHPVLTRKDFMGNHEWCFYGWREGAAHQFFGPNNAADVWSVKKINPQSMVHLTEKPVELAARALQYSSRPGEHVLDLFAGSGSTLIAAQQTGRKAFLNHDFARNCSGNAEVVHPLCGAVLQHGFPDIPLPGARPSLSVGHCRHGSVRSRNGNLSRFDSDTSNVASRNTRCGSVCIRFWVGLGTREFPLADSRYEYP
jgi:DNA modification methylase